MKLLRRARRLGAPLALTLALLSSYAHAEDTAPADTADEADLLFELGAEAYQRGEYREALERFLTSNRLVPNRNVIFNIARTFEKLGRYAEAHRYYVKALDAEGDAALRARIQAALDELSPNVAVLDVKTSPPGATVYIDRKDLGPRGETPRVLGLPAGSYTLLVERPGYHPREVRVDSAKLGERRSIELTLLPILGTVVVEGEATRGATVRLGEGAALCTAPCEFASPPGRQQLRLDRPGYRPFEGIVDVRAQETVRVRPTLEALTGTLLVETDEIGALVELDGQPAGFTPLLVRVPVGEHAARVSLAGYDTVDKKVVISEAKETRLALRVSRIEEVTAASRRKENVLDAPSSVSVISGQELRLFAYPTIAEALRGVPGVYSWDDRSYPSLGFRGVSRLGSYGNRVLVLFDDHPANDNWVGSSYVSYDARTDLSDVERIEIVRGPGSVLYGTNAFAGVVNVVTREPRASRRTEAGVSAVEDGVGRVRVRQDAALGKDAALWTSVALARGEGREFQLQDPVTGEEVTTPTSADGFESGTLQGRFTRKWLTAQWFAHTHEKHQPTGWFETLVGDPRTRQRDSRAFFEVRAEPKVTAELASLTRAHVNYYRYEGIFPREPIEGGVEEDEFKGSWAGLEQRFVFSPSEAIDVTLGGEGQLHFQAEQRALDNEGVFLEPDEPKEDVRVGAAYAMVDARTQRLHVSAGARLDAYSTFGTSLNPRLAFVGKPYEGGNTKLIAGKAFRAPSIYELYYNDGGYTQVSSPDLEPENVLSVEFEHSHRLAPTVIAGVGAFTTRTTDLIVSAGEGTMSDPIMYRNADAPLATAGVEATVRREWRQGWMLEAGYTRQVARFLASDSLSDWLGFNKAPETRRVANVPGHLFSVKGAVPIVGRALLLGSRLTLESGRYDRYELDGDPEQSKTDAFALWDVVLSGYESRTGVRWNAGVYNAFDWQYDLPVSSELSQTTIAQRGRTLLLSADVDF
jgi:outer membrane receptor protein involved in Fe transport